MTSGRERFSSVSRFCPDPVNLMFENRTHLDVRLFQINNASVREMHKDLCPQNTLGPEYYEPHAWACIDKQSGLEMLLNGRKVFQPFVFSPNVKLQRVYIRLPVLALQDHCIETIRRYTGSVHAVHRLGLPERLGKMILHDPF